MGARVCATGIAICTATADGGFPLRPACSQFPPLAVPAVRLTVVLAGTLNVELCAGGALVLPAVY